MSLSPLPDQVESNIVWIDCEMTGPDPKVDTLLEIAVIVTDKNLNILAEGPNLVIHQPDEVRFLKELAL